MKTRVLMLVVLLAGLSLSAQTFISARAGLVNYEEGKFATSPHQLQDQEIFRAQGRAEILLMPGTYMRLERSAEIQMASTRLMHPAVELRSGLVAIEASTIAKDSDATFSWGDYRDDRAILIEHKGLYRFEVSDQGDALKVMVQNGQLHISGTSTTLHDGQELILSSKGISDLAKFDKKSRDDFDLWATSRAGTLSVASYRSASTLSSYAPGSNVWAFNSWMGMYTFLPYGGFIGSPYGGYGYYWPGNVYNYYPPSYGYYGGYNGYNPPYRLAGPGGQNGGISAAPRPAPRVPIGGNNGGNGGNSNGNSSDFSRGSAPSLAMSGGQAGGGFSGGSSGGGMHAGPAISGGSGGGARGH
jgi:hypothetical protein